ncbi:hypothetical protein BH09SUM1_BH09SUM1_01930 [soil metagenome]
MAGVKKDANVYTRLIEEIFRNNFRKGESSFTFLRAELEAAAEKLGVKLPKNLGDVLYSFRYRSDFPESIRSLCPADREWALFPAGRGIYRFAAVKGGTVFHPNPQLLARRIPDATPGIIARYALSDEQALLAKVRYNRLVDLFTQLTCYPLQSHLRTAIPSIGQVETDELYVGLSRSGSHFVIPVQAKGGKDRLNIVQVAQDMLMCEHKFPGLVCRAVGAVFMEANRIALFEFRNTDEGPRIAAEMHYELAPPESISADDLRLYRQDAE